MKNFSFLTIISILFLLANSCTKSGSDSTTTGSGNNPQTATYYLSYKVAGTTVSETEVTAQRGTSVSPRTLTITGNGAAGANPKFKFFTKESFIGFVPGLTIGNNLATGNANYIEYTNSASLLHSTTLDKSGIILAITEISYTNGGNVKGIFDGSIKAANGTTVAITEGKFNSKFSN